jgi:aminopeptidase N
VVFGERLLDNYGGGVWHDIVYEKGAWIFHMLRQILGDQGFNEMQRRLLRDYSSHPLSNEDLRREAAALVPSTAPDHSLNEFFDTWVYGTGIPTLSLLRQELVLSGVDDDFAVNVPLNCQLADGKRVTRWIHAVSGANTVSSSSACKLPSHSDFLYR